MEIVFFISLILVLSLLLSKYIESKTKKKTIFQRVLSLFDEFTLEIIQGLKYRLFQAVQIVRFLFLVRLPEKAQVSYAEAREATLREYKKKREVLMGRKVIKANGAVSFFLKRIKEDADSQAHGKIEQTL